MIPKICFTHHAIHLVCIDDMPENLEENYTDEEDAGLACKDHHGCWKIEGHYSPLQDSDDFGCRNKEINCYQCTSKATQVLLIYLILFHQKVQVHLLILHLAE